MITIRPIAPEDLSELVQLCAEHATYERTEFEPVGKAETLREHLFRADPLVKCLVAEEGGNLLGYVTYMVEFSTWDADRYMHMDCLFLRPQARNKGIGKSLMRRIAKEALAIGVSRMQWQTPTFNVDAIRFYERMGPVARAKQRMFLGEEEVRSLALD